MFFSRSSRLQSALILVSTYLTSTCAVPIPAASSDSLPVRSDLPELPPLPPTAHPAHTAELVARWTITPNIMAQFTSMGCYADDVHNRTLPMYSLTSGQVSIELCATKAADLGYAYFGVQHTNQCWASPSMKYAIPASSCGYPCAANQSQDCGGFASLNMYKANSVGGSSSSSMSTSSSSKSSSSSVSSSASSSSLVSSASVSSAVSPSTSASSVSSTSPSASPTPPSSTVASSVKTSASSATSPSTTVIASTSAASSAVKSASPSSSSSIATTSPWSFTGCYSETSSARALSLLYGSGASMTPQVCQSACKARGYSNSGLEYANQCWCGNGISAAATLVAPEKCSMPCAGDKTQTCGGSYLVGIYTYTK